MAFFKKIFALSALKQSVLVFLSALLIIWVQLFFLEKETPYADNISYMAVALPLLETGVFEDGNFKNTVLPPGPNKEGMFFAPLYPAFLSVLMAVNEGFRETARCSVEFFRPHVIEEKCELDFMLLWTVQSLLAALSCLYIWLSAQALFDRPALSWLAVFLVTTLGTHAYFASIVMLEALLLPLFYASCYYLILSIKYSKLSYSLLTGLCCGALILTKSSFLYLAYFMSFILLWRIAYEILKQKQLKGLCCLMVGLCGIALVIGPWMYRNHSILGHAAVTFGYGPFTLAQRVAYNDMTMTEWWVSWVYGIPGEGDTIASKLFPKDTYERWEYDNPDGFYQQGNNVLRAKTLEEAGSHSAHLDYLIKNHIVDNLPKHILTTFPIAFRGMWVFELWVFVPYIAFLLFCFECYKSRHFLYLIYSLPPWFLLGLHSFVSVNIPRYNIILQSCLAMALAWLILRISGHILKRINDTGQNFES